MSNFNRGTRLLAAGRYAKALQYFKRELSVTSYKELYLNLGNCCHELGQHNQALDYYLQAASSNVAFADGTTGNYPLALNNIGYLKNSCGHTAASIDFYHKALAIDPLYSECIWNLANSTLKLSNCATGWQLYEYRFNRGVNSVAMPAGPRWDFTSSHASISVIAEQGIGDKIQFARYLPLLDNYFDSITVVCDTSLADLFPGYATTTVITSDCIMPLCSLAQHFGIVDAVDCYSKDYFDLPGFNIGVVATGSATHVNDRHRSTSLNYFARLAPYGKLWSLNPGDARHAKIVPCQATSWADTIKLVRSLDLVVTVDTSIVHLAGTMGIPVLMLQPLLNTDFRWGMPGDKNVWYPSVTVIDNPGNWDAVFSVVEGVVDAYHQQTRH